MKARRFENGADGAPRGRQLCIRDPADGSGAGGRRRKPEDHSERRGLAGAVRPEEAGDRSRLDGERQAVHCLDVAEDLGQFGRDDAAVDARWCAAQAWVLRCASAHAPSATSAGRSASPLGVSRCRDAMGGPSIPHA